MASAGSIFVDLLLNDAQFREKMRRSKKDTSDFGEAAKKAFSVTAGAVAASVAALAALTIRQMHVIDETTKMARSLGIATESFQALSLVARESGVSQEQIGSLIGKSQKTIYEAAVKSSAAFKALGIDAQKLIRLSPDKQFESLARALSKIKNPTERAALSMEVFGRSGRDVLGMVSDFGSKIEEARKFNDKFNISVNDIDAAKIEAANDAFARVRTAVTGIGNTIAVTLSPVIRKLSVDLIESAAGADVWAKGIADAVDAVVFYLDAASVHFAEFWHFMSNTATYIGGWAAWLGAMAEGDKYMASQILAETDEMIKKSDSQMGDWMKNRDRLDAWLKRAREESQREAEKAVRLQQSLKPGVVNLLPGLSWTEGVTEGIKEVSRQMNDFSSLSKGLITDTFMGLENVFVEFAKTGKLSFKSMADSIISDMARIFVRQNISKPLFDTFSGIIPSVAGSIFSGLSLPKFADGGFLPAGQWGIAGEAGAELIYGGNSGMSIVPQAGGSAGRITINNYGSPEDVSVSRSNGGRDIEITFKSGMRRGLADGSMDGVMRARYGLSPVTAGR